MTDIPPHAPSPMRGRALAASVALLLALLGSAAGGDRVAATTGAPVATDPTATGAALDWLEAELAANGGTLPGVGHATTDWGLTADAALALVSHGRSAEPAVGALVDHVLGAVDDYTTWDGVGPGYEGVRLVGPLAKVVLLAGEAARPATVGGTDLQEELRSLMAVTGADAGRFGDRNPHGADTANTVGQALAVLALAHGPEGAPGQAVRYLLAQQCPSGGFPLRSATQACTDDADADPDASALVVQALLSAPRDAPVEAALGRAVAWLLARADPATGGFGGTGPTGGVNANSTGLVAHALATAGQEAAAERAAAWMVASLQLGSTLTVGTPAAADAGAIAYDPTARAAALGSGIDAITRDQWRRSTAQAVLALGADPLGVPVSHAPVEPATTTTTTAPGTTAAVPTTTAAPTASIPPTTVPTGAAQVAGATGSTAPEDARLAVTGAAGDAGLVLGLTLVVWGAIALAASRSQRRPWGRRLLACSLVGGALALAFPAPAGAAEGPCPTADGVTVVVDFRSLGAGLLVRCAAGPVSSGFDALARAGIDFDTAVRSPGFLCRIEGEPSADPCIDTSPADAHWSYWLAERGGRWCYSDLGAGSRRPPPGTVEGWSFSAGSGAGSTRPPGIDPPPALPGGGTLASTDCDRSSTAPTVAPTTSPPPTTAAGTPGGSVAGTAAPPAAAIPPTGGTTADTPPPAGTPPAGTAPTPTTAGAPADGAPTTTTPAAAVAGTSETRDDAVAAPRPARSATPPAGSTGDDPVGPLGTAVAGGLVAALVAGSLVARRRHPGATPTVAGTPPSGTGDHPDLP